MSQSIGTEIPNEILNCLQSPSPPLAAVPLITLDESGYPHVALLSFFELCCNEKKMFLGLNGSNRSAQNLNQRGKCTLIFLVEDRTFYIKANSRMIADHGISIFELTPAEVLEDFPAVGEGRARITHGIQFELAPEVIVQKSRSREELVRFCREWSAESAP